MESLLDCKFQVSIMLVFLRIDDLMAAFEAIGEIYSDIFRAVMGHHFIITISLVFTPFVLCRPQVA